MSKILVIGDACMDIFVYCRCDRLCPEAPVPVIEPFDTRSSYGMAGNVYRNLLALGDSCALICNTNFAKVQKARYVDKKTNHLFLRIDTTENVLPIESLSSMTFVDYDAVVISDYNKGFLSSQDIEAISKKHPLTFLDTKKVLGAWANDITFIKINRKEYAASKPFLTPHLQDKIIETLGEAGCSYLNKTYPVKEVEIKNLSGAGDSFLAGLVSNYVKTKNIDAALEFANNIATIIVQKIGVSTIKD